MEFYKKEYSDSTITIPDDYKLDWCHENINSTMECFHFGWLSITPNIEEKGVLIKDFISKHIDYAFDKKSKETGRYGEIKLYINKCIRGYEAYYEYDFNINKFVLRYEQGIA